jgi:hypothetical protein
VTKTERARCALQTTAGFLRGMMGHHTSVTKASVDIAEGIERAIGALTPGTEEHSPGALAQCTRCGRYTNENPGGSRELLCDCGRLGEWSRSFPRPRPDARWSLGWRSVREGRVIG